MGKKDLIQRASYGMGRFDELEKHIRELIEIQRSAIEFEIESREIMMKNFMEYVELRDKLNKFEMRMAMGNRIKMDP